MDVLSRIPPQIHVFGSCEKKLDYIGKVNAPCCVCVSVAESGWEGGGLCFPSGQALSFVSSDKKLQ